MIHPRPENGQMNIRRVISALEYKNVYRNQCSPSKQSKPDQQVVEGDKVSTHVSSDEVPNGAEIHSARAAPGALSSVSPLVL